MLKTIKKSVKAGKLVDTKHVDSVIRNYKQERWVHNSKRIGKEDSLSVWYSLEELEAFLAKAKDHGSDGIKIYFGAYDKKVAPEPMYEGRQTVVLVATKEKETETGVINKDVYINTGNGNSILAFNAGRICPPMCGHGVDTEIGITIIDKGKDGFIVS